MLLKYTLFLLVILSLFSPEISGGDLSAFFEEVRMTNPTLIGAKEQLQLSHLRYRQVMGDYSPLLKMEPAVQMVEGEKGEASFHLIWQVDDLLGEDHLFLQGGWRYDLDQEDLREEYSLDYSIRLFSPPHLRKEQAKVDYLLSTQEYAQKERMVLKEILRIAGEFLLKEGELALAQKREELLRLFYEKDEMEYDDGLIPAVILQSSKRALERQGDTLWRIEKELNQIQQVFARLTNQSRVPCFFQDLLNLEWSIRGERDVYLHQCFKESASLKEAKMRIHLAQLSVLEVQRLRGWQTNLHLSYRTPPTLSLPDWQITLGFNRDLWGPRELDIQEQEILLQGEKRRMKEVERDLEEKFHSLWQELLQLDGELGYLFADYEEAQGYYDWGEANLAQGFISSLDFLEVSIEKKEISLQLEQVLWQRLYAWVDVMDFIGFGVEEILFFLQSGSLPSPR